MKPHVIKALVLTFLCLFPIFSFAQNTTYANLVIQNPQRQWEWESANLSEVTLIVKPQGIYTEVGIYFTITDHTGNWGSTTQLEAVLDFGLPEEAIVNDSWLWIDDIIVKADIIDRWTASEIYEEIVDRRQDPSILFKNSATDYQLRIYPLFGKGSRKAKINLLLPNTWSEDQVLLDLPYYLFQNGNGPIPPTTIRVVSDSTWKAPSFSSSDFSFIEKENEVLGKFYEAIIPEGNRKDPALRFNSPIEEGVFLKTYNQEGDNYYELVLLPTEVFAVDEIAPQKLMVLLHYDPANTHQSLAEILQEINKGLKQNLDENDRFNFMFTNISPEPLSPTWLPAGKEQIDSLFNTIQLEEISSFFLPELLIKGTNWVVENSDDGKVFLFANSSREIELDLANQLLKELRRIMATQNIPFYISDYQLDNFVDINISGVYYTGNAYLYTNLSRITNGAYRNHLASWFDQNNDELFAELSSKVGTMDLYTSLQNGFCFNRFNLDEQTELTNFNKPIRQVGRYNGELPFVIEVAGELDNQVFFDGVIIPKDDIDSGDIETKLAWSGEFIKKLEREVGPIGYYGSNTNNRAIYDIIDRSIQDRVLSLYTAFLALEPSQGGEPCTSCLDQSEEILVNTVEQALDSVLQVEVLPNPFQENVQINVQFRQAQERGNFQFAIFNTMGQLVKSFDGSAIQSDQYIQFNWDGTSNDGKNLAAGMYLFSIRSELGQASWRLVKL